MSIYEIGEMTWNMCQACDSRMIQRSYGYECPKCSTQLRWVAQNYVSKFNEIKLRLIEQQRLDTESE